MWQDTGSGKTNTSDDQEIIIVNTKYIFCVLFVPDICLYYMCSTEEPLPAAGKFLLQREWDFKKRSTPGGWVMEGQHYIVVINELMWCIAHTSVVGWNATFVATKQVWLFCVCRSIMHAWNYLNLHKYLAIPSADTKVPITKNSQKHEQTSKQTNSIQMRHCTKSFHKIYLCLNLLCEIFCTGIDSFVIVLCVS